jgi:hypothetical protein
METLIFVELTVEQAKATIMALEFCTSQVEGSDDVVWYSDTSRQRYAALDVMDKLKRVFYLKGDFGRETSA